MGLFRTLTGCGAIIIFAAASLTFATGTIDRIQKLVQYGCVLLNDESGKPIVSINKDQLFLPASTIKVLTSYIALDELGKDYRFRTECFIDSTRRLVVRGYGDPYLISDEIRLFAAALKAKTVPELMSLCIDRSFFDADVSIPGINKTSNPYDALNGALVVNFNTINVRRDQNGTVFSGEEETPLTPLAVARGEAIAVGTTERINLSFQKDDCERYAGELLLTLLREQGFIFSDTVPASGCHADTGRPILSYINSRALPEVLVGLLKYSNNFIANQIFLTVGAEKMGAPASMKKSRAVFEAYIREKLGIPESQLVMVEGSGISRDNKVTGNVMLEIMERFKPHVDLLSLKQGHPTKSGTLFGVSNYVGYIRTAKGLRSYVIFLNQKKNNRDTILTLLASVK